MPKLQAVVQTVVKLALKPTAKAMLVTRAVEYAGLQVQAKKIDARMDAIKHEVETLFVKEKQGAALMAGADIDGHKFKLVCGESSKFDKLGFMKKHGLTEADFEEFTEKVPKKPYVKVTPKGGRDD